jgi:HD-GYP domain-containing protein (c-di-GMP phosphodiesterase class II)
MTALLRETEPDAAWIESLDEATQHIRRLAKRDPDTALYLLLQKAAGETDHYSARHAMVCAIVCELCAAWLEWPPEEIDALAHAALTMNLAMSAIQDALVWQSGPLSEAQRQEVGKHAAASAALLAKAGVSDALWLDVIRQHHSAANGVGGQPMPAAQRLAQLLHRVDIYTAKLSRRASRDATTPSIAARDACLDQAGIPDATGATILRVLGLYPPGSFVLLANGEVGVVVRRGVKAHTPTVALVRRANGGTYTEPMRRDTTDSQHAVVRGMAVGDIKVRLNHERVLSAT